MLPEEMGAVPSPGHFGAEPAGPGRGLQAHGIAGIIPQGDTGSLRDNGAPRRQAKTQACWALSPGNVCADEDLGEEWHHVS